MPNALSRSRGCCPTCTTGIEPPMTISFKRRLPVHLSRIFDCILIFSSFFCAALTSYLISNPHLRVSEILSVRIRIENFVILVVLFVTWLGLSNLMGLYRSRRLANLSGEIVDIFKTVSAFTLVLLIAQVTFRIQIIDNYSLILFWVVSSILLIAVRLFIRLGLKLLRKSGHNLRQMVIIGTGERARNFAHEVRQHPHLGYRILGFVDNQWEGIKQFNGNGLTLLTDFEGFKHLLKTEVIDEVVIGLPVKSHYDQIYRIVGLCEEQGILIRFLSDLFDLKIAKATVDHFGKLPVLTLNSTPDEQLAVMLKRGIDIAGSFVLLVFLLPVFVLTAVLIRLDSPGPVFFRQTRIGLNKRRFDMIKFRSMVQGAEKRMSDLEEYNEVDGPVFKIRNDPRITRIGTFIRKTSIDELPQLINVFLGDMSLVGPRPLPVRDYEGFDTDWHLRRFSVRPGITCLWQVEGRSDISFDKWMELDMQYIDKWSLWLDVKILFKTIPAVIRGQGAS